MPINSLTCCSFFLVFLMALATSTADTSLWASAAAEAARPPGVTAAAAPLIADPRPRPRPTATGCCYDKIRNY